MQEIKTIDVLFVEDSKLHIATQYNNVRVNLVASANPTSVESGKQFYSKELVETLVQRAYNEGYDQASQDFCSGIWDY